VNSLREKRAQREKTTPHNIRIAFVLVAISGFLALVMSKLLGTTGGATVVFLLAIILISRVTSSYLYSIAASFACALIAFFIFASSRRLYANAVAETATTLLGMLLIAFLTGALTMSIKRQARRFGEAAARAQMLNDINQRLIAAQGIESIRRSVVECLHTFSGRSSVFYTMDSVGDIISVDTMPKGLISFPWERQAAETAWRSGKRAGAGTGTCAASPFIYLPVISDGSTMAVGAVLVGASASPDEELVHSLKLILAQSAIAIERQRLVDEQQRTAFEAEKERIRSNFLRAISHDLRSPLTAILGACLTLDQTQGAIDSDSRNRLIDDIREEAEWMLRMVENLLSVTRVGDGAPKLTKVPEPLEELIGEAVERAHQRFPEARFEVLLPEELLMVPMDATLIVQVLMNLIENSIKHALAGADARIAIAVIENGGECVVSVRDYGKGLADDELDSLFVPIGNKHGDSTHGLGIGLSICRSVIQAHGGVIRGCNHEEGGAEFVFTLPLEEPE